MHDESNAQSRLENFLIGFRKIDFITGNVNVTFITERKKELLVFKCIFNRREFLNCFFKKFLLFLSPICERFLINSDYQESEELFTEEHW